MIFSNDGLKCPVLGLDRATADALAVFCQQAFQPQGRRKAVARHWDLRDDEARSVIEGTASKATLDRIWKHKNGGWRVLLPVMGAVIGQTADAFIIEEQKRLAHERRKYEEEEAHLDGVARTLRVVVPLDLGERSRRAG